MSCWNIFLREFFKELILCFSSRQIMDSIKQRLGCDNFFALKNKYSKVNL